MKCALIRWWMEEYIDGTLDGKRAQWIRAHLQHCQGCSQELAWRRSLRETLTVNMVSEPPQDMWQDFQRRLAERARPTRASRTAWWQWGTAAATAVCALVLVTVWWRGHTTVPEQMAPSGPTQEQSFASNAQRQQSPALRGTESHALPPSSPKRTLASKPIRTAKASPFKQPGAASAPKQSPAQQAPQVFASVAYAEVRNEQGELVSRVLLQTTYDENGQPRAVQIEYDTAAAVEVESNDEPVDSSDNRGDTGNAAGSPDPTAGTRPGLSD